MGTVSKYERISWNSSTGIAVVLFVLRLPVPIVKVVPRDKPSGLELAAFLVSGKPVDVVGLCSVAAAC